jgi:hypothetical protein
MTEQKNLLQQWKRKWLTLAVSGLILNGAGLSLMGEALIRKSGQQPFMDWFLLGTLALVLINAGISLVGGAVVVRVKMEMHSH